LTNPFFICTHIYESSLLKSVQILGMTLWKRRGCFQWIKCTRTLLVECFYWI